MRVFLLAAIGLLLAACNQTAQTGASPTTFDGCGEQRTIAANL